ncbi:MAG: sugar ABC transporter permease [Chloroflexi bacterium]|nr:sugar ABC transporter permease [Chloroflexota bacterium]
MKTAAGATRRRGLSLRAREEIAGWLWTSPWLIGFVLFVLGPMLISLYLSLTNYAIGGKPQFVGLDNFTRALSGRDDLFWPSIGRTVEYAFVMVPIGITLSLLAATLLNQGLKGTSVFRTLFFLPSLTPVVASAVIWRWLYQPDFGAINWLLWELGVDEGPRWLTNPESALPSLMLIGLWGSVGGGAMVIFLAGLQGVPRELHDAASMDGANAWQRFRNITLPMISPTIFFNLVIGIIAALKVFAVAVLATQGGPNYATWFFNLHLYNHAFQFFEMGYASALAWIFFFLVVALTYLNVRWSRNWVHYEGEVRT